MYFTTSTSNGFKIIDDREEIIFEENSEQNSLLSQTKYIEHFNDSMLILSTPLGVILYNYLNHRVDHFLDGLNIYPTLGTDCDKNSFFSNYNDHLIKVTLFGNTVVLDSLASYQPSSQSVIYAHFFFDTRNYIFISKNLETIVVFDSSHNNMVHEIDLAGGLLSLNDIGDSVVITNYNGLFSVSKTDYGFRQILDKKKVLAQQIYGLLIDDNGYYWMSTNEGLFRYDPRENHVHKFKMSDGLQGMEYNTMSYLKDSKGRFLFGGVNGLNIFDPLKIKFSDKQAGLDFYNYKINDKDSRDYGVGNYIDKFDLDYSNHTITFEFVGIDYSDPDAVDLRYYMEGYDEDWIYLEENDGVARYAKLPHGDYTFHMNASNADGIWSEKIKSVDITVTPPYYLRWWFQVGVGLALLGGGYFFIRSYFQRRIEKKDMLLKHQQLLLEKQQAVEKERTRIAGEMHDDLGSGLTTIKFLSDHALSSTKSEQDAQKIEVIADQANQLVSNMSEIIWAMNSRFDSATDLIGYIRHYTSQFLETHERTLRFENSLTDDKLEITGEKRRNIFLVTKEVLHNYVKHSEASEMHMQVRVIDDSLEIAFQEIGSADLDPISFENLGNGIHNMSKRMENIHGSIRQEQNEKGLVSTIKYPLQSSTG